MLRVHSVPIHPIKQTNNSTKKQVTANTMADLGKSVYFSPENSEEPVENITSHWTPEKSVSRQDSTEGMALPDSSAGYTEHADLTATVVPEEQPISIPKKVTIVEADNVLRDRVKYLERLVDLLVEQRAPGSAEIIDVEVVDFRGNRRVVPAVAQRTVVVAKARGIGGVGVDQGYSNLLDSVYSP